MARPFSGASRILAWIRLGPGRDGGRCLAGMLLAVLWTNSLGQMNSMAADQPPVTAKDRAAHFAWFSDLGFPDVKETPFVRVATGVWEIPPPDKPAQNVYEYGFLLSQTDADFRVFFPDLSTKTFTRSRPGTEEHKRVGFDLRDLPTFAADRLKAIDENGRRDLDHGWGPGVYLAEQAELFVLAWACAVKGHANVSADLYHRAAGFPNRRHSGENNFTFRQAVAADIAQVEMWRAVLLFEDTKVSRTQIFQAFQRIIRNYPESKHIPRARETETMLKKMILEDLKHAEFLKTSRPFSELGQKEQISELIFQLRNESSDQWMIIDYALESRDESPILRLIRIGPDAVPQLMEALDDQRFTRAVQCARSFFFSHTEVRVSGFVYRILTEITHVQFHQKQFEDDIKKYGPDLVFRREVLAWHARVQKKGEKTFLIDEVEAGNAWSLNYAERLVDKFPEDASSALMAGARKTDEFWIRGHLVWLMGQAQGKESLDFLLHAVQNDPEISCRLSAANALSRRGRTEGVLAMAAEWRGRKLTKEERPDDFVSFFARCGRVEAIEALQHKFTEHPIDLKVQIVSAFHPLNPHSMFFHTPDARFRIGPPLTQNELTVLRMAAEKLMQVALDDTDVDRSGTGTWHGDRTTNPRVCDHAGQLLHDLEPVRYPFDITASVEQRDRALLNMKNVLREIYAKQPQ